MRFTAAHLETLGGCIALKLDDLRNTDTLKAGSIAECLVKMECVYDAGSLSYSRLLWDLFWLSGWNKEYRSVYGLYNDSHIETALRQVVKDIKAGKVLVEP